MWFNSYTIFNNANKSVVELFGKPENINRLVFHETTKIYWKNCIYIRLTKFNSSSFQFPRVWFDILRWHWKETHCDLDIVLVILYDNKLNRHLWIEDFKNPMSTLVIKLLIIEESFHLNCALYITADYFDLVLETNSADTSFCHNYNTIYQ